MPEAAAGSATEEKSGDIHIHGNVYGLVQDNKGEFNQNFNFGSQPPEEE